MSYGYDDEERDRQAFEAHNAYHDQNQAGFGHAVSDYGAAVRDMNPAERPPFIAGEWRDSYGQPSVPDWADDSPPAAEPVGQCGVQGCACAYGGRCPAAPDPYDPGGWY